jgi:hypothetical protein
MSGRRTPGAAGTPDPWASGPRKPAAARRTPARGADRPRVDPALYRRDWAFALWHILVSMGAAFVPQLPVQDETFEPLDWPDDWFDEWFDPYLPYDSGWGDPR